MYNHRLIDNTMYRAIFLAMHFSHLRSVITSSWSSLLVFRMLYMHDTNYFHFLTDIVEICKSFASVVLSSSCKHWIIPERAPDYVRFASIFSGPSVFYGEYLGCSQLLLIIVAVNWSSAMTEKSCHLSPFANSNCICACLFFSKWSLDLFLEHFIIAAPCSSKINKVIFAELQLSFMGMERNG